MCRRLERWPPARFKFGRTRVHFEGGEGMRTWIRRWASFRRFFGSVTDSLGACSLGHLAGHVRRDGLAVAFAAMLVPMRAWLSRRDPGERAAERYLRALGFEIIARNWRSPRDSRDEADLLVLTPCRTILVVVEVKRSNTGWNALDRIDQRKREVLWRIVLDLEQLEHARTGATKLARILRRGVSLRVDAIGVQGHGASASVTRHIVGIFVRRNRRAKNTPRRER